MTYQLPYRFVERTDELAAFVRDYEATVDSKERAALLTKALVTACQLLSSIDLPILEMELQRIYAEVRLYEREAIRTQTWYEAMFEEPGHFAYFLDNVEAGILCSAGLSQKSCQQILNDLRYLREHAAKSAAEISPQWIIAAIKRLWQDVCALKNEQVTAANQRIHRIKVAKTIMVSVIVIDAAGSILFPAASPAALAASVTLGGVAQFIPE